MSNVSPCLNDNHNSPSVLTPSKLYSAWNSGRFLPSSFPFVKCLYAHKVKRPYLASQSRDRCLFLSVPFRFFSDLYYPHSSACGNISVSKKLSLSHLRPISLYPLPNSPGTPKRQAHFEIPSWLVRPLEALLCSWFLVIIENHSRTGQWILLLSQGNSQVGSALVWPAMVSPLGFRVQFT